jgi:putative transposase
MEAFHGRVLDRAPRPLDPAVCPGGGFDPAIWKIIYTTNAIESLNRIIRKSIKTRGSFPT